MPDIPNTRKLTKSRLISSGRIMSVVVRAPDGKDRIISKGAPEAIFPNCRSFCARRHDLTDGSPAR